MTFQPDNPRSKVTIPELWFKYKKPTTGSCAWTLSPQKVGIVWRDSETFGALMAKVRASIAGYSWVLLPAQAFCFMVYAMWKATTASYSSYGQDLAPPPGFVMMVWIFSIMNQNKPLLYWVACVGYFVTAKRKVTNTTKEMIHTVAW